MYWLTSIKDRRGYSKQLPSTLPNIRVPNTLFAAGNLAPIAFVYFTIRCYWNINQTINKLVHFALGGNEKRSKVKNARNYMGEGGKEKEECGKWLGVRWRMLIFHVLGKGEGGQCDRIPYLIASIFSKRKVEKWSIFLNFSTFLSFFLYLPLFKPASGRQSASWGTILPP